jgi:hypothetical protein
MQKLKVWWIPQVPMNSFDVEVSNLREARLLLNTLANYDIFQYKNNIKPDYCNVGGLMVFEDGDWCDWYDNDTGDGFDDLTDERIAELDSITV